MSAAIIIKKAEPEVVLTLQSISSRTFVEAYANANTPENVAQYLEEWFNVEQLIRELVDEHSEFYFAFIGEELAGYLKINFGVAQTELSNEKGLEIERIYILNKFKGNKAGKALYEKAVLIAKQLNAPYIWLGVWEGNQPAISFYKKLRFKEFGTHPFKFGNEIQTDIMMKLELQ